MPEHRALWVSTSLETRGGIATYVQELRRTPMWSAWDVRHVATHRDGSAATKLIAFARGSALFVFELTRFRPELVHLHSSADASFVRKAILLWISRGFGVPVVLHMHGSDFQRYYDRAPAVVQALIRRTLDRAEAVVALGEVWATLLRAISPTARVTVIPNAVRPARRVAQPPTGQPVRIVFLGRIGDRKGTFRLIDAWARLAQDHEYLAQTATLTIAGDGEVEAARSRIRELGLSDSVELREWLCQESVEKLLDESQALVLPSRNEGQPMAVLEAMARGLCIVSSDVGGLSEMVGEGCGVVVDPDDVEAIAEALRLVISDDRARIRYGAAAHQRCREQFDVLAVSRRIDELYREVTR